MLRPDIHMPDLSFEAKTDCAKIDFCSKHGIVTDFCYAGAKIISRCQQADFAQIFLLTRILGALEVLQHKE